jgi:hypothetical protein
VQNAEKKNVCTKWHGTKTEEGWVSSSSHDADAEFNHHSFMERYNELQDMINEGKELLQSVDVD